MAILSRRARRVIPITISLILAACLLTIVGGRMVRAYQELRNEQRVRQGEAVGVLPWMTLPYIARTYSDTAGEVGPSQARAAVSRA